MDDVRKYYIYKALMKRFSLPVLVFHMSKVGISVEQIGLIGSIGYGSQLLLEFPSGALADKIGYRKTLAIAGILNVIGLALFLGNSFWWFLASAVVYWSGAAFRSGADSAFFYERLLFLKREKEYRTILGNIRSVAGIVALTFALLSGAVYQIHWTLPFIFSTAMALVYSLLILTLGDTKHKVDVNMSLTDNMRQAIKQIIQNRTLLALVVYQAVIFGLMITVNEFNGSLLEEVGIVASIVGVIYALRHLLMSLTGQLSKYIDGRVEPTTIFILIAAITGSLFMGYGIFHSKITTAIILILVALPQTLLNVSYADYAEKLIESKYRASVKSAAALLSSLVLSAGLLVVGIMTSFFDLRSVIFVIGILIIMSGLAISIFIKDEDIVSI